MTKIIINGKRDKEAEAVFHGNQHVKLGFIKRTVLKVKRFVKWFWMWTKVLGVTAILVACFAEGYRLYMTDDLSETIVHEVKAEQKEIIIPEQLQHIADCESGRRDKKGRAYRNSATHFDTDGTVLERGNTDRSIDIGWAQNNSIHKKEAKRMGLDLRDERNNKEFALHLYKTEGSTPWKSSLSCWIQPYAN
jgi:hypothetical protein